MYVKMYEHKKDNDMNQYWNSDLNSWKSFRSIHQAEIYLYYKNNISVSEKKGVAYCQFLAHI